VDSHGVFNIQCSGSLLWVRVSGGINYEFACRYRDAVITAASQLPAGPWVRVTDIRDWELGGPEVILPLQELMIWCERQQLQHSINLVSLVTLQTHMLNLIMQGVERHSLRHLVSQPSQLKPLIQSLLPGTDLRPLLTRLYADDVTLFD
jgi:hypothetical protein